MTDLCKDTYKQIQLPSIRAVLIMSSSAQPLPNKLGSSALPACDDRHYWSGILQTPAFNHFIVTLIQVRVRGGGGAAVTVLCLTQGAHPRLVEGRAVDQQWIKLKVAVTEAMKQIPRVVRKTKKPWKKQ